MTTAKTHAKCSAHMLKTLLSSTSEILDQSFDDIDARGEELSSRHFENCSFKSCTFSEASFRGTTFLECQFAGCDLSNVQFTNARLRDVLFHDSKLVGIDWASASAISDIVFKECAINFSFFEGVDFRKCTIENCIAREVDFSGANMSEANLQGTDFAGARFSNTNLEKADLRSAVNYSIDPNGNKIRKAKFSLPEAMSLLHGLGIEVEE